VGSELLDTYIELRRLSDIYYDVQKVRTAAAHRLRSIPKESYVGYPERLKGTESLLVKDMARVLERVPVWSYWLGGV